MSELRKFHTYDGKYTTTNDNGKLRVYRHDKECKKVWREDDLIGDGYVLSLVQRIEDLEDEVKTYAERDAGSSL